MSKRVLGIVLALVAFLVVYGLFPNMWLLGIVGSNYAAWVGLFKLVAACAAAVWVHHRWSRPTVSDQE